MRKTFLFFALATFTLSTTSCSRDNDEPAVENYSISPNEVNIKYDKTQQFTVRNGSSSIAGTEFTWKSSDEKRGTVNNSGLLTANKVGTFQVTATKNGKTTTANVTISPYQNFFKEPIMGFGKTKAEIKAAETRQLQNETATGLAYKGENNDILNIGYTFDSSGKMTSAIAIFPSNTTSVTNTTTYYKERYLVLDNQNGTIMMKDLDNPIFMGMSVNPTLGFNVIYTKQ
ncbi:Ig-like domain-containing protein [Chryseobacterium sp. T1]|jgi:hypothetical protein